MLRYLLLRFFCLGSLFWASLALAAENSPTPTHQNPILKVGIVMGEPIAYQSPKDGSWQGIAVLLWQQIAEINRWQYTFVPAPENTDLAIQELAQHHFDVLIGGITVTYPRLKAVDFSRAFMMNKMVVFEKDIRNEHFLNVLFFVMKKIFNWIFLLTVVAFIVIANALWFWEHRHLHDLNRGYFKGILYAMWSVLMLLIGGLLVDKPQDRRSRLLVLSILIGSMIFSSLVAAAFTSSLTFSLSHNQTERAYSISDIRHKRFAAVEGYSSAARLESVGGQVVLFPTLHDALMGMLNDPKIDGIAGNVIVLTNAFNGIPALAKLQLLPIVIGNDEFAFAFPKHGPYRDKTDLTLTQLQDNDHVIQVCQRYVDPSHTSACIV